MAHGPAVLVMIGGKVKCTREAHAVACQVGTLRFKTLRHVSQPKYVPLSADCFKPKRWAFQTSKVR